MVRPHMRKPCRLFLLLQLAAVASAHDSTDGSSVPVELLHMPPPTSGESQLPTAFVETESTIPFLEQGRFVGRGRGRGRAKVTYGPEEFDSSWWLAPPSVGPDSFLRGYDQRVYPHGTFGYGGMPNCGFGSGSLFWGGPTYHNALNVPWFHDMAFNSHPRNVNALYSPYLDLADTFGRKHGGGLFPMSSPYISFPPPLQGDWNLPHSPNMVMAPP